MRWTAQNISWGSSDDTGDILSSVVGDDRPSVDLSGNVTSSVRCLMTVVDPKRPEAWFASTPFGRPRASAMKGRVDRLYLRRGGVALVGVCRPRANLNRSNAWCQSSACQLATSQCNIAKSRLNQKPARISNIRSQPPRSRFPIT